MTSETRIPTRTRVWFRSDVDGRLIEGKIVEHKLANGRRRYRVRIAGSNKRLWLSGPDLELSPIVG